MVNQLSGGIKMPVVYDNQVDTSNPKSSSTTSSSGGRVVYDDTPSINITSQPVQDTAASGLAGTTLGALGSGAMKGGEMMLNTAQGASNIIQSGLNAVGIDKNPAAQDFSDMSKAIEMERVKDYGNQQSLHGKVLEGLAQLPSIIAMVGTGKLPGLLGMTAGPTAFATQAVLQTKGNDPTATPSSMAWQGTKAAVFGAVLGKAAKMGPASGPLLAATYAGTQTALEGGDPNDVLAGAISASGLTILSNPKNLAHVWSGIKDTTKSTVSTAGEVVLKSIEDNTSVGTAASSIVGKSVGNWYQDIKAMNASTDRIAEIDQKIAALPDAKQEEMLRIKTDETTQEQLKTQQDLAQKEKNTQALNEVERAKTDRLAQQSSLTQQSSEAIDSHINELDKELSGSVFKTVQGLKDGGKITSLFNRIDNAYETSLNNMGEKLSTKSPITRLNAVDWLTSALSRIAQSNENLPGNTTVTNAINREIDILKMQPFKASADAERVAQLREMGVSPADIAKQMQSKGKIDMGEEVPFGMAKAMLTRIKNSDPYGSHEASIVRHAFGEMVGLKLGEDGQPSPEFNNLQSSMSDAISLKNKLAQVFALKQGKFETAGGVNFLESVVKGDLGNNYLLGALEKGIEVGGNKIQGIGDISTQIKELGTKLSSAKESFKNVGANDKATIANIGLEFAARMDSADKNGKMTQGLIDAEHTRVMDKLAKAKQSLEANYQEQLKSLKGDKGKQQELEQRKKDVGGTINILGLGVSAFTYKVGAVIRIVGRFQAKKATGFGKRP